MKKSIRTVSRDQAQECTTVRGLKSLNFLSKVGAPKFVVNIKTESCQEVSKIKKMSLYLRNKIWSITQSF